MEVYKTTLKQLSIEEAKAIVDGVKQSSLEPGDKWYLISSSWWDRFLTEQESEKEVINLPPINNKDIIKDSYIGYVLKNYLVEELHYTLLPEKQFMQLKKIFGVEDSDRDVIYRRVVVGAVLRKEPFIEVYPLILKVAKLSQRTDIKYLKASFKATFDQLKKKAFDLLNVPESKRSISKILVEKDVNEFEEVGETESLDTILQMDTVFYVYDGGKISQTGWNQETRLSKQYGPMPESRYIAGLCGLQNLGNTCFMNSALQCLSNVPQLTEYFLSNQIWDEINSENVLGTGGKLAKEYQKLVKKMWSGKNSSFRPFNFKCVIGNFAPRFNGYSQQDSQELMAFLLDGLHEDLNRIKKKPYIEDKEGGDRPDNIVADEAWVDYKKRNDSIIVDLMHGQLKSTVECNVCKKTSIKFDPFCFLSVPVPAKTKEFKSIVIIYHKKQWKKLNVTHTDKTLVKEVIVAIQKELELDDEERVVLVPKSGYLINILDEEASMPVKGYGYYSKPSQVIAYICKAGPLIIIENQKQHGYRDDLTYPIIANYDLPISHSSLVKHVVPTIRALFCGNYSMEEGLNVPDEVKKALEGIHLTDYGRGRLPENEDEVVKLKKSARTPIIQFKWKKDIDFVRLDQLEELIEEVEIIVHQARKGPYTLEECIELFTTREQLDENEAWYCPVCINHQRAFKKLEVWKLPKILIVHLKRFQYTRLWREKIDTEIAIPVKSFSPNNKIANPYHKPVVYDLVAVSNHMGGLGSGHYTADALLKTNEKWCAFNDSYASVSSRIQDPFSSNSAYILVYKQQDTPIQEKKAEPMEVGK